MDERRGHSSSPLTDQVVTVLAGLSDKTCVYASPVLQDLGRQSSMLVKMYLRFICGDIFFLDLGLNLS